MARLGQIRAAIPAAVLWCHDGPKHHPAKGVIMKAFMSICIIVLIAALAGPTRADDYVAFSLREAQARLASGRDADKVVPFAGITELAGMVVDANGKDIILIGIRVPQEKPLTLDDLVVGLRSRLVEHQWPLVSLDNTQETPT